jgi:hypothetical protein
VLLLPLDLALLVLEPVCVALAPMLLPRVYLYLVELLPAKVRVSADNDVIQDQVVVVSLRSLRLFHQLVCAV